MLASKISLEDLSERITCLGNEAIKPKAEDEAIKFFSIERNVYCKL